MEDDQSSLLYLQRLQVFFRPRRIIEHFEASRRGISPPVSESVGFFRAHESRLQSESVSARNRPQTSILDSRIFKREPKSNHSQRLCEKKCRVLMTSYFAADTWLLEDVHGL